MAQKLSFRAWAEERIEAQRRDILRRFEAADAVAQVRMKAYYTNAVKEIFQKSVSEFYDDMDPILYRRRESMYNLLRIEDGPDGIKWHYDPSVMAFRNDGRGQGGRGYNGEDGLYDQVFRKGWHGGAGSGPNHPDPGTPYYRYRPANYRIWSGPAVTTEPPLDAFNRRMDEFDAREAVDMWRKISFEEFERAGLKPQRS